MDSMKGQEGIQLLLIAVREAQHIVSVARNLKMTRLKQAKDEAEKEMVNYRSHVESEYQKKLAGTSENSGATVERLDEKTEIKIKMLKESTSTSWIALLFLLRKGREDRYS